jgi:[ribosomal protein S5]-alanine N-acetyltransferase
MLLVLADQRIYDYIDDEPPVDSVALIRRYSQLESRRSPNGAEQWLNWIIRRPGGPCIGFVQATIYRDASASIAFVLNSQHWGQGYGQEATDAMLRSIAEHYSVRTVFATVDSRNTRSRRLLFKLGFQELSSNSFPRANAQTGDVVFVRELGNIPIGQSE